jgi:5-methyltetrahydropteroyltriglutamate--homocysteine methyltransferase
MNPHSIAAGNLGYPRIGLHRELKVALERFWSGEWSSQELEAATRELRAARWRIQAEAGIVHIPSNDFSLYDHVLDAAVLVGAIPARFGRHFEDLDLPTYFAMARGSKSAPAMEMTKWFDTNYHYIVPELESGMEFHLGSRKPVEEFLEARALGLTTRPVLLGPVSLALLGKTHGTRWDRATIAQALVGVYRQLLIELAAAGADWVQMDEPCLGLDLPEEHRNLFGRIYEMLILPARSPKILLTTYFSDLGENLEFTLRLPVAGVHLDLVRGPGQFAQALALAPDNLLLSLGVVDGRNIWRSDLDRALEMIRMAAGRLGSERIQVAPSCSLLHIPVDLEAEHQLDPGFRTWLAFARQKLDETALLARAATEDSLEVEERLAENRAILGRRHRDRRACDPAVRGRTAAVRPEMFERCSPFPVRREKQTVLRLPILPTTTIGSFPQTAEVRRARAVCRSGKMARTEYEALLRAEVERTIRFQEEIGLDVLVHGEFERNDMVEYFGEQLRGFAFTGNGWVQSYGSRCVKPPLLFGDVSRTSPMTTAWAHYAQSLTELPVKGMLTGPVTLLEWSFVRDDLPKSEVAVQLALALRDEVADLEGAGMRIIQVDEPALREGLPLRRAEQAGYLRWSVDAFRLATSGANDETQIHTHMCYSEFADILDAVVRMDADVLSVEAARSQMELLDTFNQKQYPNDIGPGIYDIHSPRVPDAEEIAALLRKALTVLRPEQLWVNPDCGLKTRGWDEVRAALRNMVAATRRVREQVRVAGNAKPPRGH